MYIPDCYSLSLRHSTLPSKMSRATAISSAGRRITPYKDTEIGGGPARPPPPSTPPCCSGSSEKVPLKYRHLTSQSIVSAFLRGFLRAAAAGSQRETAVRLSLHQLQLLSRSDFRQRARQLRTKKVPGTRRGRAGTPAWM